MPLLDHFHPPLYNRPPWSSITTMWAAALARWLNRTLPTGEFVAFPTIHLGAQVEADVAEFDKRESDSQANGHAGVATLTGAPPAVATFPIVFPDDIEIRVGTSRDDWNLCGVIELVSEGNKKEIAERDAFINKCAAYLQRGIGLIVVDIVTNRLVNLHNKLMKLLGGTAVAFLTEDQPNYVAAYGPVHRLGRNELDVWPTPAHVGLPLPKVPFALRRGPRLLVDLEATYLEAVTDLGL